jgi:dihydrofolate reductase
MAGGTVFHFVTEGIHAALEQATAAAGGRDVRIGGGVATIRQYLSAGLADEVHLALRPVLLGSGEHLLQGIDRRALGYDARRPSPESGRPTSFYDARRTAQRDRLAEGGGGSS